METFTRLKDFVENPHFHVQKKRAISNLSDDMIDVPIVELVTGFNKLPYCFTLQCCYGHFVYNSQNELHNLEPLPARDTDSKVEYRIAYIVFCLENGPLGRELFEEFKGIIAIDPENIQFCCAEWFWKRQINSYVLQVEPERFRHNDTAVIEYREALHIEKVRNKFFDRLYGLLKMKDPDEFDHKADDKKPFEF